MITAYKIYNPNTGLFSCGTKFSTWTKYGKTWNTIGHIHQHFRSIKPGQFELRYLVPGCLLVVLTGSTVDGVHSVVSTTRKLTIEDR